MVSSPQVGLMETNGELKVFIDQNLSPSKGEQSTVLCSRIQISVIQTLSMSGICPQLNSRGQ